MSDFFGFGREEQRRGQQYLDMLLNDGGNDMPSLEFRDQVILATIIESFDYLFDRTNMGASRPLLAKVIMNSYRRGMELADLSNEALVASGHKYGEAVEGFLDDAEARRNVLALLQKMTRNHIQSI